MGKYQGYSRKRRRVARPETASGAEPADASPAVLLPEADRLLSPWLAGILPLFFFYEEAAVALFTGSGLGGLRTCYLLLSAAAFGLLAFFLVCLGRTGRRRCAILSWILFLSASGYAMAALIRLSFQAYMTPKSILSGTGDAVGGFAGSILSAIRGSLPMLAVMFALPVFLHIIVRRRSLLSGRLRSHSRLLAAALSVCMAVAETAAVHSDAHALAQAWQDYDFTTAVQSFGLITALALDAAHESAGSTPAESFAAAAETAAPTAAASASATPVIYGRNELPIDFAALAEGDQDEELRAADSYVASQRGSMQNAYTGLFRGKNLILITAESFASGAIDPEITPTLYRLATRGITFDEYYQPAWGGSTTTGEYSILTGLIPTDGVSSMKATIGHNLSTTIGSQLKDLGYFSRAYHDNTDTYYDRNLTHENFGYEKFIGYGNGMEEGISWSWPCSDDEMMQWTLPQYIDEQPFSIYYITVSAHAAYTMQSDAMAVKNIQYLRDTFPKFNDYSEKVQCYLAADYELEKGLTFLMDQLEAKGIADDTVICLSADHYPYGLEKSAAWGNEVSYLSELYGYPVDANDQPARDRSTLILWCGSIEDQGIRVSAPVSSIDIVPTLANLFGTEFDSRLYAGRDVFSDAQPLTVWMNRSWKTDLGTYSAWSGVFTPNDGAVIPDGYVDRIQAMVRNRFAFSLAVLNRDYYAHVFGS